MENVQVLMLKAIKDQLLSDPPREFARVQYLLKDFDHAQLNKVAQFVASFACKPMEHYYEANEFYEIEIEPLV